MGEDDSTGATSEAVDVTISIDEHTVIEVTGERDLAVVVRSAAGEHIYLPPADFDELPDRGVPAGSPPGPDDEHVDSPYRPTDASTSPYEPVEASASPYQPAEGPTQSPYDGFPEPATTGIESTPSGIRIVHPEPIVDLRLLR